MSASAAQTIGPFWHLIEHPEMADLTRFGAPGEVITLTGRLFDGAGAPIADACVELWQASPPADDRFPGFGRSRTDADGRYRFTTLRPGPIPGPGNSQQAPHVALNILARGIITRLVTRAYFAGDPANDLDPLLACVEPPGRRSTMIAVANGAGIWTLDLILQGPGETVFLDI